MTSRMRAFLEESTSVLIRTQAPYWGPALAITSITTSSGRSMAAMVMTDNRPFPRGNGWIVVRGLTLQQFAPAGGSTAFFDSFDKASVELQHAGASFLN